MDGYRIILKTFIILTKIDEPLTTFETFSETSFEQRVIRS